jgi:Fringe-like
MFSPTTLRPPGRFLKVRFLLPIIVFLAVVRFSRPGSGWGFSSYANQTWSYTDQTTVPDDKLKGGFDHDRENELKPFEWDKTTKLPKKYPAIQKALEEQEHFDKVCGGLRSGKRIVITLNTGATEILERVPTLLKTSLLCAPNVYIFSDLAHTLGDRQVYDSLDTVPAEVMKGNTDFDLYRKQLELKDPVKVAEFLKGMKDPKFPDTAAAWTLDKYKKLHILEKAWDLQPEMDWYLHIDADTYVIWSSLVEWLAKLDPTKESYLGSLSFINNLPFGHGGSGMLMSGAAMRNFVVHHNGTAGRWDYKIHKECCADWVLAQILKEYGMKLMNSWPTIQGESQSTIPFDGTRWCQPLVTMHHVSPFEAQQMGDFEAKREDKTVSPLYKLQNL